MGNSCFSKPAVGTSTCASASRHGEASPKHVPAHGSAPSSSARLPSLLVPQELVAHDAGSTDTPSTSDMRALSQCDALQPAVWGSGSSSVMSGLLGTSPLQAGGKPGVLTVTDFNHEIQDLAFIGAGASGDVYRGRWQGATVAVKYVVCQSPDAQQAATNEAALGRLLAHPNVVQTYSCKTAVLDHEFFHQLNEMLSAQHAPPPDLTDGFQAPADADEEQGTERDKLLSLPGAKALQGGLLSGTFETPQPMQSQQQQGDGGSNQLAAVTASTAAAATAAATAAQQDEQQHFSGEGFSTPLEQCRQSVLALQEVLLRADAKLGYQLTQIVMEYCDKGSLLHAIQRGLFQPTSRWGPRLALRALLRTAQEVAQGMWHIHQANVIHGDLKPGNVLLKGSRADRRGFVAKVSDFGLSRVSEHTTRDSQHWGTVHYAAPETFDGVLARHSDVYSFGITLWQMMTGQAKPWGDLHPGQIIVGVQAGTLTLDWPEDVHPRLVKLGRSCLEYERKKRPGFNVIMKELSQIENMVRLQGAILPSSASSQPPSSSRSSPQGTGHTQPEALYHAATDPDGTATGSGRGTGGSDQLDSLALRAASCSAVPASHAAYMQPHVPHHPHILVPHMAPQPVGYSMVPGMAGGPVGGPTSPTLPPVVQVVTAMGGMLHSTPSGLQLCSSSSQATTHSVQVYHADGSPVAGGMPFALVPAHMVAGPPGSGQTVHVVVSTGLHSNTSGPVTNLLSTTQALAYHSGATPALSPMMSANSAEIVASTSITLEPHQAQLPPPEAPTPTLLSTVTAAASATTAPCPPLTPHQLVSAAAAAAPHRQAVAGTSLSIPAQTAVAAVVAAADQVTPCHAGLVSSPGHTHGSMDADEVAMGPLAAEPGAGDRASTSSGTGASAHHFAAIRRSRLSLSHIASRSVSNSVDTSVVAATGTRLLSPQHVAETAALIGPHASPHAGSSEPSGLHALLMQGNNRNGALGGSSGSTMYCHGASCEVLRGSDGHQPMQLLQQVLVPVIALPVHSDSFTARQHFRALACEQSAAWGAVGPGSDPSEVSNCMDYPVSPVMLLSDMAQQQCGSSGSGKPYAPGPSTTTSTSTNNTSPST